MKLLRIVSIATFLAGLSHITLQAYSHFGMHFYFVSFLVIGLIQLLLGVLLWQNKLTTQTFWITTLVHGTATVFWLLTRTISAPFIDGVEHFSIIGVSVVSLQILSILLLCIERKSLLFPIYILLGSTALGFASHFGAMQLENYFPELKGTGGHHGGGHHSTMSDEEHSKMMNNHHKEKSEESHDHAECGEDVCPTPPQVAEEINNPEPKDTESHDAHGDDHH